jgi:hypothetical protein
MSDKFTPSRTKSRPRYPTPPYISFLRLKVFVQPLQQTGIPDRLDLEFFDRLPTGDRRQLQTALQYLQLIDAYWRPTQDLVALVDAYGDERWPAELSRLLRKAYRPLLESGLPLATQEDLSEAFREIYDGTDDVLRKSRTFFLHAAHEAQIDLAPAVFEGIKPRVSQVRREKAELIRVGRDGQSARPSSRRPQVEPSALVAHQATAVLLELWDTEAMSPDETRAIQTLLKYCARKQL